MVASLSIMGDDAWYLDSGANYHLTHTTTLNNVTPYTGYERVTVGNDKKLHISSVGPQFD